MKYQVIARKFRPQVFEDIVGQRPIVQTLCNAINMDRIGHAYLFSGPRGVGKTTTARLLAKALNCAKGPTAEPCNECPSCQEIAMGQSIDVLEIDAASNTGVDAIRELRQNALYAPSRDRNKIFIVDEVHMLSTSAFNALLKILEEPPSHVAFIMATTERHKLPATILSRCQQFVFRTIPPGEIFKHLQEIGEREGVKISEGALDYIVKAAEGSMRDAQSLLDQIIAFGGQDIADDDVRDVLGFIPKDILDRTVEALIARDSSALLAVVEIVVDQGLNLQQFVKEFLARIRDLLLARLDIADKILASSEEREAIASQAKHFSEQDLIRFFDMLLGLENDLRWTSEPRFHLEVGCLKLAKVGQLRDIEEVIRELKPGSIPSTNSTQVKTNEGLARHPRTELSKKSDGPPEPRMHDPKPTSRTESRIRVAPPAPAKESGPKSHPIASSSNPTTAPTTELQFEDRFREKVREASERTDLYLQRVDSMHLENNLLKIKVSIDMVLKALEDPECKQILESVASKILGKTISILLVMDPVSKNIANTTSNDDIRASAKSKPLVQSFLEVFRGEIAQVKNAKHPPNSDK